MCFFIDTHAHLYLPEFENDRAAIVENAVKNNVIKIFLPNIDTTSIGPMKALAARFPGICYPMMGLHPTSVWKNTGEEMAKVEYELEHGKYIAVGETGIDLYWDKKYLKEQSLAFSRHVELSLQYGLPLVIHARESFSEILEILEGYRGRGLKGIFHAFTGTAEIARKVVNMGFKLGIGGIVTYKNASLPDVVRETDLSNIVLETDAPYLTPAPFRGKRNESGYITYVADAVKQIKNITLEEVAAVTTGNVLEMFSLDSHG